MTLEVRPISLHQARAFVQEHHRHHEMPQGGLWALALVREEYERNQQTLHMEPKPAELLGVAIAGRPVSRVLQRQGACEIVRVCVLEGVPNGCSMLYGRCRRVAQAMGYTSVITYTLARENGASLKAANFEKAGAVTARSWNCPSRPRRDRRPPEAKTRWEAQLGRR